MLTDLTRAKSFRSRALSFWVPVVILEAIVAVFLADYVARKGLNERIEASLTEDAKLRSIAVIRALDEVEEKARRLAIHPGIRRSLAGRDRLTTFLLLTENVRIFPIGTRLAAIDMRGAPAGEATHEVSEVAATARSRHEEGLPMVSQEQVFVKEVGISYVLPILSGADVVGNLLVDVPWSHVGVGLNLGGPRDYLLAADGKVRIASRRAHAQAWESAHRPAASPASSGEISELFNLESDLAVSRSFRSGDVNLEIVSVALASEVEIPLAALRRDLMIAFGFLGLTILAVTVYLTRLLSRPLAEIDRQVQEMARAGGMESRRVKEGGTAETASLARRFKEFIIQIQRARENEARLLQQLALREKMAGLGTLAGGVAHEFNNALGGIVSNVESALHDVSDPSVREDLELVRKVALRASAIAKNLLGFARQAMRRGDTLTVSVREAGRPVGGRERRMVEIAFTDTGVGIPEENLSKIFEPFFTTKGALGGG